MKPPSRNQWALLAMLGLFTVLLVPLPAFRTRLATALENFAHAPLFALVAWGAWRWLRSGAGAMRPIWITALLAWLMATTFAIATELVQPLTGRDDSLQDIYTDITGATAALLALLAAHMRRGSWRSVLSIAGALAACGIAAWPVAYTAAAYRHRTVMAPQLVDLGSGLGRYFLQRRGIRIAEQPAGGWLVSPLQSPWPGLTVDEVLPDWRDYSHLLIDVSNPGNLPVTLLIRIDDRGPARRYADRFNSSTVLAPGTRVQWRLPLSALQHRTAGRSLDLADMRRVILFQDTTLRQAPALPYVLHGLRLER